MGFRISRRPKSSPAKDDGTPSTESKPPATTSTPTKSAIQNTLHRPQKPNTHRHPSSSSTPRLPDDFRNVPRGPAPLTPLPLPQGWSSAIDSSTGRTYYFRRGAEDHRQWEFPVEDSGGIPRSELQKIIEEANRRLREQNEMLREEEERRRGEEEEKQREEEEVKALERRERKTAREAKRRERERKDGRGDVSVERVEMDQGEKGHVDVGKSKERKHDGAHEEGKSKLEKEFSLQVCPFLMRQTNSVREVRPQRHRQPVQRSHKRRSKEICQRRSPPPGLTNPDRETPREQRTESRKISRKGIPLRRQKTQHQNLRKGLHEQNHAAPGTKDSIARTRGVCFGGHAAWTWVQSFRGTEVYFEGYTWLKREENITVGSVFGGVTGRRTIGYVML
jgi:hypothetical protein